MESTQNSAGISLENQVEGLPGALHTEARWMGQEVLGPAPIDTLDNNKT